jgi:predicted kinase
VKQALTPALMRELADRIAAFHRDAEREYALDSRAVLLDVLQANTRNLKSFGADVFDPAVVGALDTAALAAFETHRPLFDRRQAAGKIRSCHGDLHLRNICLIDGRPTLFDCLEFSPAFSRIDILYDLAFLLMDLLHRGVDVFASTVFNRYLDRLDDIDGLAALPLFLSTRAAIRAHVTAASAANQRDDERRRFLADAARYLTEAIELLRPRQARLIAIGGLSGTGKSTLAAGLAPDLGSPPGARVLRTDMIRKHLLDTHPETRLPAEAYHPDITRRVYRHLQETAAATLATGVPVIVDAVFATPAEREAIEAVARAAGVTFTGLWLSAPSKTLADRIEARRGDASDADVAVLSRQLTYDLGRIDWSILDAGGPSATCLAAARTVIRAKPQPMA